MGEGYLALDRHLSEVVRQLFSSITIEKHRVSFRCDRARVSIVQRWPATYLHRSRPYALPDVLHIRVSEHPADNIPRGLLEPLESVPSALVLVSILLLLLVPAKVLVRRDRRRARKVLQTRLGLGGGGGVVRATAKVLVRGDTCEGEETVSAG